MAVKSIELSPAAMKDVKSEVSMLKSLTHVNIVRYLGAERDSEKLHIFQEWVPGGSVTTLLNKFGSFSAAVMRSYLSQVLTGLAYLHDNNILHRDIKGGNVLINDEGIVKLADFGAAKRISHQQSDMMESLTMRGTPFFMAPEVFEEHYNGKADIWAVGCVAFQMATGSAPWKKEGFTNPMSLFLHLQNSEGIPLLEWPEDGSMKESEQEPFENMLKRCFWRESTRRPTAHGLIADDFFTCASSSEDDCSQSRALFSPGGDSASTFTPAKPRKTPRAQGTPPLMVRNPKTSFLSPPLPSRIIKTGTTPQVSPLMTQSPARNINAKEWPTWAREQLKQEIASPNMQRPSPKPSPLMDSLAFSTDTSDVRNPFARRSDAASSVAMSTLDGLQFLDISQK
jgi:serine/threonine protein kinase